MTQQHVITLLGVEAEEIHTVLSPRSSSGRHTLPYFLSCFESHISSWATLMLTKHQLVIAVLEWPIKADGQGAAGVPKRAMPREAGEGRGAPATCAH